jgi:predicted ATPase
MLIQHLQVSGLLSFGRKGIDLPMRKLNVLIGPNGSGKSNLLEVINLYREAPSPLHSIAGPIMEDGGIQEWLWKEGSRGDGAPGSAIVSCQVASAKKGVSYKHEFRIENNGGAVELFSESIAEVMLGRKKDRQVYNRIAGFGAALWTKPGGLSRKLRDSRLNTGASILAQIRDPGRYVVLNYLQEQYARVQLYRDWSFGPHAMLRRPGRSDDRADGLGRSGLNLAAVAASIKGKTKKQVINGMQILYPDVCDLHVRPGPAGTLQLYLEEGNEVEIPASRLSDGTLRYMALLLILLNPKPAPLTVIEEPEMGLHPDVIPEVAKLLIEASERTQLVVTTHSRMLVDCLGDDPESVIVCEKHEGESVFERLDGKRMKIWLEKYTLGDLWSKGELGGNRW